MMTFITEIPNQEAFEKVTSKVWSVELFELWVEAVKEERYHLGRSQAMNERTLLRAKFDEECI